MDHRITLVFLFLIAYTVLFMFILAINLAIFLDPWYIIYWLLVDAAFPVVFLVSMIKGTDFHKCTIAMVGSIVVVFQVGLLVWTLTLSFSSRDSISLPFMSVRTWMWVNFNVGLTFWCTILLLAIARHKEKIEDEHLHPRVIREV